MLSTRWTFGFVACHFWHLTFRRPLAPALALGFLRAVDNIRPWGQKRGLVRGLL